MEQNGDMNDQFENYQGFHKLRSTWLEGLEADPHRFVPMEQRRDTSFLSRDALQGLERGKSVFEWKGIDMRKDAIDVAIGQMLMWKLKPATVIEIGTYTGASALWLADHLRMFDINGHVYSMDIDHTLLDERVKKTDGITFLRGDSNTIEQSFPADMLRKLTHPWLLIEDAHVNVDGVLEHFHAYMKTGDYMVVEDTNPAFSCYMSDEFDVDKSDTPWGIQKMETLRSFVGKYPTDWMVDTFYTDMFGYNATWNINGYLRKM